MKHFIPLVFGFLCVPLDADDETSFASVPDASWQRVEPFKELGSDIAGFDFSNQTCRITCAVPSPAVVSIIGAAASAPRASLIAPTEFTNTVASVEIVSWQPPQGELFDGSFPGVFDTSYTAVCNAEVLAAAGVSEVGSLGAATPAVIVGVAGGMTFCNYMGGQLGNTLEQILKNTALGTGLTKGVCSAAVSAKENVIQPISDAKDGVIESLSRGYQRLETEITNSILRGGW